MVSFIIAMRLMAASQVLLAVIALFRSSLPGDLRWSVCLLGGCVLCYLLEPVVPEYVSILPLTSILGFAANLVPAVLKRGQYIVFFLVDVPKHDPIDANGSLVRLISQSSTMGSNPAIHT